MYKQKDRFHSYIIQPVTNIQELSYVSLQVYTHIQGHIFTDFITNEFEIVKTIFSNLNNIKVHDVIAKF
ncbi:4234_t:CDS:2 [Funneliformis mosseae]|uniref:4234_t:CDS:1 n=1 Tax=Funneliformis mosseae TaxID=27381 RepID=A0A9N8WRP4_FUNMO|nr:4234_t:CDS:2 [Funneliformis mosseae]